MIEAYPQEVPPRYELRNGRFGAYFHDLRLKVDLPLAVVLDVLNRYALCKAQLIWMIAAHGEPPQCD